MAARLWDTVSSVMTTIDYGKSGSTAEQFNRALQVSMEPVRHPYQTACA